jgi:hypothetical protein
MVDSFLSCVRSALISLLSSLLTRRAVPLARMAILGLFVVEDYSL